MVDLEGRFCLQRNQVRRGWRLFFLHIADFCGSQQIGNFEAFPLHYHLDYVRVRNRARKDMVERLRVQ